MARTILLFLGVVLLIAGAGLGYVAWHVAISPDLDLSDAAISGRATTVLTAGASVALLSGIAMVLVGTRRGV